MKGITPIISIIILLLITISLAGVAYLYMSGWLTAMTGKSFTITPGGAFCSATGTDGTYILVVTASNTGQDVLTAADFIIHKFEGADVDLTGASVPVGSAATIIDRGVNALPGKRTVNIGTASHVESVDVICP